MVGRGAGIPPCSPSCPPGKRKGALHEPPFPNPNDESRNPKEYRNPNDGPPIAFLSVVRHSSFGFLSSFVIRHSLFDNFCETGSSPQCMRKNERGFPQSRAAGFHLDAPVALECNRFMTPKVFNINRRRFIKTTAAI